MIVTFDLFSALTDSRRGASESFASMAAERGWSLSGERLYDEWDRRNKQAQRSVDTSERWVSFREISLTALADTYAALGLPADAEADLGRIHGGVGRWPLWPDVAAGLPAVAEHARIGILSNVDDDLASATRAYPLVAPELVLSSQRLGAYKPDPAIYRRAAEHLGGDLVHVAASARDVRGALEAGVPTVRLVRQGHQLDPDGPVPEASVHTVRELVAVLSTMRR